MIQGVGMLSKEQTFDDRDEWRLLAGGLSLLPGMTDTGRLGFAIQLKFRQVHDALIEVLMVLIHSLGTRAEKNVDKKQFAAFKKVRGKARLLFRMAGATVDQPDGVIPLPLFAG
jgi:hypothetical protein